MPIIFLIKNKGKKFKLRFDATAKKTEAAGLLATISSKDSRVQQQQIYAKYHQGHSHQQRLKRHTYQHTEKTQYQKFETNILIKGIVRPMSQFPHSCVCERFKYSHDRSAYSAAGKQVDRSWEYINRSQTHECGNWE